MARGSSGFAREFVIVKKGFVEDTDSYTHREKYIYTILDALRNDLSMTSIISIDMIADVLGLSRHTKNRTGIKDLLVSMEKKGMIDVYEDIIGNQRIHADNIKVNGMYAIKIHDLSTSDNKFSKVEMDYLYRFIAMKEKSKELHFIIYMNIIGHLFNGENNIKYSYPTIDTISKETGINRKTVMKYIEVMRENKIIYYETVKIGKYKDKNIYGKWRNIPYIVDTVKRIESGQEDLED